MRSVRKLEVNTGDDVFLVQVMLTFLQGGGVAREENGAVLWQTEIGLSSCLSLFLHKGFRAHVCV